MRRTRWVAFHIYILMPFFTDTGFNRLVEFTHFEEII